jgi:type VI secretion system secreted protein VgrG
VTTTYSNRFSCIPHETPFRPPRTTVKPVVEGVQTAVVVGPSGEEIYTDKYGRITVQFHWDREGKKDEHSSCRIRVSQAWADAKWGGMFIPRIGQEVIVEFLEGDPDRPIITGCVYNENKMPPYELPAEKTKSTVKSNSSKGGGGFNEFRFEDKKGNEEIFLHGQKDWTIAILNDKNQTVGHDETMMVVNNRTRTVGVNQTETIGANMSITVGKNKIETVMINDSETIGVAKELTIGGAYQVSVGAAMNETVGGIKAEEVGAHKSVSVAANANEDIGGSMTVSVGKDFTEKIGGKHTEQVSKEYILKAKKIQITADDEIVIKTGSSEIIMKKNGDITIKGGKINVKSSGDIIMKGSNIKEN